MTITIQPAASRRERTLFLTFPWRLHKDDPLWIPPLLPQRTNRLDPAKNPVVAEQTPEPLIAWRDGEPVGTIVMGIDHKRNRDWDEDNALFGYFDCIQDYSVFEALINHAVDWTKAQGKTRLWGPWNLDYEDSHGFLVMGWNRPPVVMCGHTPPYYPEYAERYGMVKARRDSLAFCYDVPEDRSAAIPEKLMRVVKKLQTRSGIVVRQADFSRWDDELALF